MKIFLIGPGGAGKSTTGKMLAKKLCYKLIDLDIEFMKQFGDISMFINKNGYEQYCLKNSELFYLLLSNNKKNIVFILSSGFLVHKNLNRLTKKHAKTLKTNGISILLLPSKDINETVEIVIKRQINRDLGLKEEQERKKINERYSKYLKFGDIQIFSHNSPAHIAEQMKEKLANRLAL